MKRSQPRLTAEGTIAFVWREAKRRHWAPKRVRRELLIARNEFVGSFPDGDASMETVVGRALGLWYRAAADILPARIRRLPNLRQQTFPFAGDR